MPQDTDIATVLEELKKTIDAKGLPATIGLLRNARENFSADHNIQFVIVSVCNEVGVSLEDLIKSHASNDDFKYAKAFIVHYLRDAFKIAWKPIKTILNHKNQVWLWELGKLIKQLNPRFNNDQKWIGIKNRLDDIIKQYKKQKS